MPSVTWEVPSLTGGVSRQPATQRFRNQVEHADNVCLNITRGAEKRAGTEFINAGTADGSLNATAPTGTKFLEHWIDRDSSNRYVVLIDDTQAGNEKIQIFNALTGVKQTVSITAGAATYLGLGAVDAKDKFVCVSVADTTFILNKQATTALKGSTTTYVGATVNLNIWGAGKDARHVANYKSFAQPPALVDDKWFAEDDVAGFPAGYYNAIGTTREPFYQRIRTEEANYTLDETTMPIKITLSGGTWTADVITWSDRLSGNSVTNPGPSFIGKKITDMAFHDNRLWFFSDEQIVSSQLGDFYNLWIDNVANLVDSDPIDIQLSGTSVNKINFAVPFSKSLLLLTSGAKQYEIKADGVLTPTSANIIPSTSYQSYNKCRPVTLGKQLYFTFSDSTRSQLWEYAYSDTYVLNVASEVSLHADDYLPAAINRLVSVENKDMIFGLVTDTSTIYGYRMLWQQDSKIQSAFFRWTFDEDNDIIGMHVYDDYLYLLIRRNSKLWIEKMNVDYPPDDTDLGYNIRMDRKMTITGSYSAGETTFDLPMDDATVTQIVLGADWGTSAGTIFTVDHDSDPDILVVPGDYSAHSVYIGRPYTASITLSEQVYRDKDGKSIEGTLNALNLRVRHKDSSVYSVLCTPIRRDTREYQFTPFRLDSVSALTNTVNIVSGFFDCKPFLECATGTIVLENANPLPSVWVSLTFDGRFVAGKNDPTV